MGNRTVAGHTCVVVLLTLSALAPALHAQGAGAPDARASGTPAVAVQGGIGLADAVKLTFQNDPQLKLRAASADFAAGVLEQQGGPFDFTLGGNAYTEYRQQELRASRKEIEQKKRDDLQEAIDTGESLRGESERLLRELRGALAAAPGSEQISDPVIQGQMVLLRAMIGQVSDATARNELLTIRRQILEQNASSVSEKLDKALSDLDDAKVRRQRLGDTPKDEIFKRSTFTLNFSKRFRNGILLSPFADGRFDGTNFKGKETDAIYGGKGIEDLYTFHGGVDLTLPLLRGRGTGTVAANERAAAAEHRASQLTLRHQAAVSALRTVRAYWDLRAAQENLDVALRSQGLQDRLFQATQQLINGGELPSADLARAQASHTRALARVEDAQRRRHEARVNLALAMGVPVSDDPAALPIAGDAFPEPQPRALPDDAHVQALVQQTPERREDLKASASRTEAGALLARGARLDLRPRLDLTGRSWVTGLGEGNAGNALDRWVGPSYSATLGLEIPLGNNLYRGRMLQREADLRQRQISSAELARQIRLNVVKNGVALRDAAARVEHAKQAVELYGRTTEAEIEKFKAGDSTLIDAILTEDQQTDARLSLVSALQDHANLVAQLRYETGLLAPDPDAVTPDSLATVPGGANQ